MSCGRQIVVVDFDVRRSFAPASDDPSHEFVFTPFLRAVDAGNTGTLSGRVFGDADSDGIPEPIDGAGVAVLRGDPSEPAYVWDLVATGRYTVGFLTEGTYIVQVEAQLYPNLASVFSPDVTISLGSETGHSVTLPSFDGASLTIDGQETVLVGNVTPLRAVLLDSRGVQAEHPAVRWHSTNPAVARVRDVGEYTLVDGVSEGNTVVVAVAGGLKDSLGVEVLDGSE